VKNFVAIGQTVAQIWRFLNLSKWRPSTMLDVRNLILSADKVKRITVHHPTRFHGDMLNSC